MDTRTWTGALSAALDRLTMQDMDVTVTYEALEQGASDTLAKAGDVDDVCRELGGLLDRMAALWTGEAGEQYRRAAEKNLTELEEILKRFRAHAENLGQITQNYMHTGSEIAETVQQGLSSDVIV